MSSRASARDPRATSFDATLRCTDEPGPGEVPRWWAPLGLRETPIVVLTSLAPGVDTIPWAFDWDAKPDERFRVDEPLVNPLVEPLTFGVQSASYRPDTGVVAWRPARQGVWNGMGEVRIRWIGQRFTLNGPEEYGQLEDLVLLADRDAVRFSIELTLPAASDDTDQPGRAAGAWDPPKVDFVDLRWDAPLPGEAAPGAPGPSAER